MTKNDLKNGYMVQYRDGEKRILIDEYLYDNKGYNVNDIRLYDNNLNFTDTVDAGDNDLDIVKVFGENTEAFFDVTENDRPLLWERKEKTAEEKPAPIDLEINEFSQLVHKNAVNHGWWEEERGFGEIVALCHSELSEALEEYRSNKPMTYWIDENGNIETDRRKYNGQKLEGIATEMIDCIIRILDWCGKEHIDVEKVLKMKHRYNEGRPYKHGGKKI